MFDNLIIKSKISGTYKVDFISDLNQHLSIITTNSIFIIDSNILKLFPENFIKIKNNERLVIIESNEKNKTLDYCQIIIRHLIQLNVRTDDTLIAIGGGITQDIVAFISSILFRGVNWIFFPTTLLAQCDSCIGSKSSINFDVYKNLLGTFKPPSRIFIYNGFLNTLTESEIRSGIGEMLHYFFTEGLRIAEEVTEEINEIIDNRSKLEYYIKRSLLIKQKIIELDEFDQSIRHIFNYGHTFGHALEAVTDYLVPHGQAITLGMDLANYISLKLDMLKIDDFNIRHQILLKNIPKFEFNNENITTYLFALTKDKKNKENKIGCILLNTSGKLDKYFIENDNWLKNTILNYSRNFIKK